MGVGQSLWLRIGLALLVIPGGLLAGGWLIDQTLSVLSLVALWLGLALAFSVWWGLRLALLFVVPLSLGFVAGAIAGPEPVDPAYYSAVTQVAPVLLLVLGLEQRSLRDEVQSSFELFLFVLLLGYVAVALVSALHATAVCDSDDGGCIDVFFRHHLVGVTDFGITAASMSAGGLIAGLTGAVALSVLGARTSAMGPERQAVPPPPPTAHPARVRGPLVLLLLLSFLLGRGIRARAKGGALDR